VENNVIIGGQKLSPAATGNMFHVSVVLCNNITEGE